MIVNTANLFPEGKYVMECAEIISEREFRGTIFWDFVGRTELEGQPASYKESFPIWLAGALFAALGFKEVAPGSYDVEPTLSLGRKFECDIVHEKIKDKVYARIKKAKPIGANETIPF